VFGGQFVTHIDHHLVGSSISMWCYAANVGYRGLVGPDQNRSYAMSYRVDTYT